LKHKNDIEREKLERSFAEKLWKLLVGEYGVKKSNHVDV
jgi:hypothetical protein